MRIFLAVTLLVLSGCGGGSVVLPNVISTSAVTIEECSCGVYGALPVTITVQPNGSATLTDETAPPQSQTITLSHALVSKLYSDVSAASPLSSLSQTSGANAFAGFLTISVAGASTPNILGENGIAGALGTDANTIYQAFRS